MWLFQIVFAQYLSQKATCVNSMNLIHGDRKDYRKQINLTVISYSLDDL